MPCPTTWSRLPCPALRHRVILTAEAEVEGRRVDELLADLIRSRRGAPALNPLCGLPSSWRWPVSAGCAGLAGSGFIRADRWFPGAARPACFRSGLLVAATPLAAAAGARRPGGRWRRPICSRCRGADIADRAAVGTHRVAAAIHPVELTVSNHSRRLARDLDRDDLPHGPCWPIPTGSACAWRGRAKFDGQLSPAGARTRSLCAAGRITSALAAAGACGSGCWTIRWLREVNVYPDMQQLVGILARWPAPTG